MSVPAIVHLQGEDAVLGDLDEMPDPKSSYVILRNLRKKDGKQLSYVADGATAFLYAWSRISFIELMGEVPSISHVETATPVGTKVLGFFRDDE